MTILKPLPKEFELRPLRLHCQTLTTEMLHHGSLVTTQNHGLMEKCIEDLTNLVPSLAGSTKRESRVGRAGN
jgi:hypothetical protein